MYCQLSLMASNTNIFPVLVRTCSYSILNTKLPFGALPVTNTHTAYLPEAVLLSVCIAFLIASYFSNIVLFSFLLCCQHIYPSLWLVRCCQHHPFLVTWPLKPGLTYRVDMWPLSLIADIRLSKGNESYAGYDEPAL